MLQKIFYWKYLVFNTILLSHLNFSQELNCKVSVNYSLVNQTESNVFNDLEKNINVFLNEKKWTNDSYKDYEKINCSFLITILDYSDNSFRANIEVNSFRPVFNSNYNLINFKYVEFFEFCRFWHELLIFQRAASASASFGARMACWSRRRRRRVSFDRRAVARGDMR